MSLFLAMSSDEVFNAEGHAIDQKLQILYPNLKFLRLSSKNIPKKGDHSYDPTKDPLFQSVSTLFLNYNWSDWETLFPEWIVKVFPNLQVLTVRVMTTNFTLLAEHVKLLLRKLPRLEILDIAGSGFVGSTPSISLQKFTFSADILDDILHSKLKKFSCVGCTTLTSSKVWNIC